MSDAIRQWYSKGGFPSWREGHAGSNVWRPNSVAPPGAKAVATHINSVEVIRGKKKKHREAGRKGGLARNVRPPIYRCLDCGSHRVERERQPKPPKVKPEPIVSITETLSCARRREVRFHPLTDWVVDSATGMPMFCCESEREAQSMCEEFGFAYAGVLSKPKRKRGQR